METVNVNDMRYALLDKMRGKDGSPGASVEDIEDFVIAFVDRWPRDTNKEKKLDRLMKMTETFNRSLPLNKISAPLVYRFLKQCGMFLALDPDYDFNPRVDNGT